MPAHRRAANRIALAQALLLVWMSTGCDNAANLATSLKIAAAKNATDRQKTSPTELRLGPPIDELVDQSDPGELASGFLSAIKAGDHAATMRLLSAQAQAEAASAGLVASTPGSPKAYFHIGTTEFVDSRSGAHVPCVWMDGSHDRPQRFTLVLRAEGPRWRVAGLVTLDGDFPEIHNFESAPELASLQNRLAPSFGTEP